MKRNIFIGIVIVLLALAGLAIVKVLQIKTLIGSAALFAPPPETITSAVAQADQWPETIPSIGSVNAEQGVTVAPEIAGTVSEIAFESGATVKQGDLLVKLDASTEEAQLRSMAAMSDLMNVSAERTRKLRADGTASQSELDQAEANLKQASANSDNVRALIEKKTIRAPFSGKLGIRLVNLGQQLDVGKGIVSLQSLSPVFVDFSLPQQDLSLLQTGLAVQVTSDAYPGQKFSGTLTAINPDLNSTTRSVQLRAKFENTDERLRPGMFVRTEVVLDAAKSVLAIPATAVLSAPYGDAVYVIESSATNGVTSLTVQQKFIRTGRTHGDFVNVESGLKAGDRVVTSGLFKLRNGASVQENNTDGDSPKPSLTPHPPNS